MSLLAEAAFIILGVSQCSKGGLSQQGEAIRECAGGCGASHWEATGVPGTAGGCWVDRNMLLGLQPRMPFQILISEGAEEGGGTMGRGAQHSFPLILAEGLD